MSNSIGNPPEDRDSRPNWSERIEQAVRAVSIESRPAGVVRWPDQMPVEQGGVARPKGSEIDPQMPLGITGADSCVRLLLPGSFNPLHRGHVQMAEFACHRLGCSAWFELSLANADKPPIDAREAARRLLPSLDPAETHARDREDGLSETELSPGRRSIELDPICQEKILKKSPTKVRSTLIGEPFDNSQSNQTAPASFGSHGLLLTSAATYVEKARLFPGCTFALGADTIERVADVRFYAGDETQMESAISELADLGCRFLVFGRLADGKFTMLGDLKLPQSLRDICSGVDENDFRHDIASRHLRNNE